MNWKDKNSGHIAESNQGFTFLRNLAFVFVMKGIINKNIFNKLFNW